MPHHSYVDMNKLWPPAFEGAIFDFDGTLSLTHDIWTEVDRIFLGSHGIEVTADYQRRLSTLGFEAGAQYTIETYHLSESVDELCATWNRLGRALYETHVRLREGAESYIDALRTAGIPCALATVNDPHVLASCQQVDVGSLFDTCVYGREVARPKDFPDIYLEAARRLNIAPERCIVFEDLAPGLRAAHQAGLITCALASNDPAQQWDEICHIADVVLHDWTEIKLPQAELVSVPEPVSVAERVSTHNVLSA
jgi:HAD superfamily hydrolase (TIGR01509 family)